MKFADIFDPSLILPKLNANTQEKAFEEMAQVLAPKLGIEVKAIVDALIDRETTRSTALEKTGVAIPHARLNGISDFTILFARSKIGIDFKAEDGKSSHLFFLIVGPENKPGEYLRILARVARLCHSEQFRSKLMGAKTAEEINAAIAEEDAKS